MYLPKPESATISAKYTIMLHIANTPNSSGASIRAKIMVVTGVMNFTPISAKDDHLIELAMDFCELMKTQQ